MSIKEIKSGTLYKEYTLEIPYEEINVWEDETKREEMLKKSGGRTSVPQIFIGDHHVGGNDELQAANKTGELDKLLA